MNEILERLGLQDCYDFQTIIKEESFNNINISLLREVLKMYNLNDTHLTNEFESKFHHINRILMLKYEIFICPSKFENGYQLETVLPTLIEY